MTDGLLSAKDAAAYLDVSPRQLRRLPIARVKFDRAVKYERGALERYVALRTEQPRKARRVA